MEKRRKCRENLVYEVIKVLGREVCMGSKDAPYSPQVVEDGERILSFFAYLIFQN